MATALIWLGTENPAIASDKRLVDQGVMFQLGSPTQTIKRIVTGKGGGKDVAKLDEALAKAKNLLG